MSKGIVSMFSLQAQRPAGERAFRSVIRSLVGAGVCLAGLIHARPSTCEVTLSLYGGAARTQCTDLRLETGGSNLTFEKVCWSDASFSAPIYYGLRGTWWSGTGSRWGLFVDFTHAKMYARLDETTTVHGSRDGREVDALEPVGRTFETLEFSHGHNLLILGGAWRWLLKGSRDGSFLGRLRPHVLAGLGAAVPHIETTVDGIETADYQIAGLALQAGAGLTFDVAGPFSLLAEYRISWADIAADLEGGGSLDVDPWTSHYTFGFSFSF